MRIVTGISRSRLVVIFVVCALSLAASLRVCPGERYGQRIGCYGAGGKISRAETVRHGAERFRGQSGRERGDECRIARTRIAESEGGGSGTGGVLGGLRAYAC